MADIQNFRIALRGFNRQDVVKYIEYINNRHSTQIAQLTTQVQNLRDELAQAKSRPATNKLEAQLEAAQARCAQLEAQLANAPALSDPELEAYRRAERTERMAQERANRITEQLNAVLADATANMDAVSQELSGAVDALCEKLQSSKQELQDTVNTLYALAPKEN